LQIVLVFLLVPSYLDVSYECGLMDKLNDIGKEHVIGNYHVRTIHDFLARAEILRLPPQSTGGQSR